MDLRKIKKLIELVEESGIAELEVKSGEEAVRISMATAGAVLPAAAVVQAAPVGGAEVATQVDPVPEPSAPSGTPLTSPLSGTFYAAPAPDAAVFVGVGDSVTQGDVVCIVESMKMMNRIEADRSGTVAAVLVANGEPVESGQPLFLIDG